jgi:hypothetical protein
VIGVAALVVASCSSKGSDLATAGKVPDLKASGDAAKDLKVVRVSQPLANGTQFIAVVHNGTGANQHEVQVAATVADANGNQLFVGNGQVGTPVVISDGGFGAALVTFAQPVTPAMKVTWAATPNGKSSGHTDMEVAKLNLDGTGGKVTADVKNSAKRTLVVAALGVICYDDSGEPFALFLVPGATTRVSPGSQVQVTGDTPDGCAGVRVGAVGVPPFSGDSSTSTTAN